MTYSHWLEPTPRYIDEALIAACDGDAFLAHILLQRGFTDPQKIREFLSPKDYMPAPPEQLPGLAKGSALIQAMIADGKRILVWGDFDVDGQTAAALLVDGLERLGANVAFYIPNRITESHGIKLPNLQREIARHMPDLLITCDTGTTEFAALDYARSIGLPVIVTDHHDLADHLPDAYAVINPRRLPDDHPLTSLPGVGVAYKLMQHVYASLGRERELPRLLDLVALGIVGDVADQTADTRYLLQTGLERLRRSERIGLQALMEVAKLSPQKLTAEQIGFQIGPRLNAAGRLGDATLAVELLITHSGPRARILAQQLEGFNNERRVQTSRIDAEAERLIEADPTLLDAGVLVLYQADWNPGILGIVATRLAERYRKPVILLAGQDIARGSARSIAGFDINKALAANAYLLNTFGGHPGAAGLSLPVERIAELRQALSHTIGAMVNTSTDRLGLLIDAVVTFEELTHDLAQRVHRLAPFGEGNPPVTLATLDVHVSSAVMMGYDRQHRRLLVEDDQSRQHTFLWWRGARESLPGGLFDIAYTIALTDDQQLQFTLVDLREHQRVIEMPALPIHFEDWRADPDPAGRLTALLTEAPDAVVWAEAYSRKEHPTWKRRAELTPASTLIVYTVPPDSQTFRDALDKVQPQIAHILAAPPPQTSLQAFIAQLTVAARNVIEHLDGKTSLAILCGATAQSPQTVRAGLDYLVADGRLDSVSISNRQNVNLTPCPSPQAEREVGSEVSPAYARLEAAYRETEAYRRYFRAAPLDRLTAP